MHQIADHAGRRRVAPRTGPVEHELTHLRALDEDRVVGVADRGQRVGCRDHRGVHAGGNLVVLELGDREELHHVPEARGVGDILRGDPRDPLAIHVARDDPRVERDRGEDRALGRRIEALDIGRRIGLGVPESLRLGQRVLERPSVLRHLRQHVVRRAVHDPEHPADPLARQRFLEGCDQRDPAGDGCLEPEVALGSVRRIEQLLAGGRQDLLVGRHHRLAGRERRQDQFLRRLRPPEELEHDVDVGVGDDRGEVGREDVARERDVARPVGVADRHAGHREADRGAHRDVITVLAEHPDDRRSHGPAPEHPDPDRALAHVEPATRSIRSGAETPRIPSRFARTVPDARHNHSRAWVRAASSETTRHSV